MYLMQVTCPSCGELHAVQILPVLAAHPAIRERDVLREQLASAITRAAKAEDALTEMLDAGEWTWSEADNTTLFTIHLRESTYTEFVELLTKAGE